MARRLRYRSVPDGRRLEAVPPSRPANMADDTSLAAADECLCFLVCRSSPSLTL